MRLRRWGVRVGHGFNADGDRALIVRRCFTKRGAEHHAYYRYERPYAFRSLRRNQPINDYANGPHAKAVRL